jgi:DNA invertase Pin-like site-specific DNA recombinase
MPHPVAYLRKSKSDDPAREVSREEQQAAVEALALADGYQGTLEVFVDWDRSADEAKGHRRTEFIRLIRAVEAGEVSVIYASAPDRLYRSLITYGRLVTAIQATKTPIVTKLGGELDLNSPDGGFSGGLGALLAARELAMAKRRARNAYEARVARGDWIGRPQFGRLLEKNAEGAVTKVPDPNRSFQPVIDASYRRTTMPALR